ncbi:hypothetical protein HDF16_004523 [Granulicella aggregans]|uniref:Glc operon protein GlcG n=1 Tax=Granulicella aggregans TaxID=474949 RepID=A0A7W8E5Y7_9BACT|nr:hypothetical protein [Granulicella aggregans]MBB5059794.1 hypothetical protein [Granulicella aggregans]
MSSKFSYLLLILCAFGISPILSSAQSPSSAVVAAPRASAADLRVTSASFDASAGAALQSMKARAEELKIGGAAVVAYFDGDKIESWSSKMLVVGRMKDEPTATDKGSNLLAIVYAKAAEMADTLKDSGSKVRPPMTGEFGWEGGVIVRVKTGYIIAAFSGGKSEDDVAVSRVGAAKIVGDLRGAR